ncbi:MAG: response regulator [Candidatus Omnitrophica bacterium]|jgi:two-component system alkaline phosphatase synthesis response regulator PhoP|nr:response regulator [Candidatus Omnitrophota bacterium]MDD5079632.1 response regulator [Candidatus Omnitrophota bacterium]
MINKKKVLVIDDSKLILTMIADELEMRGFEFIAVSDGAQGLKKVKESKPDIIILDLILPGLSGEEVCREIRRDERTFDIPVIMLTAKNTDADKIIGKVIGADCYIPKPFEMDNLLKEITRLIK